MQIRKVLFVYFTLLFSVGIAKSDVLIPNIASTAARVEIGKAIEITAMKEPLLRDVICGFSITPMEGSSKTLVLAGTVVDNNTGSPMEFIPIFFGSKQHLPRLAALTNAKGEFCFSVWVSKKRIHRLQTAEINNASLYLGGFFNKRMEMISSHTYVHSMSEFLKSVSK